MMVRTYDTGKRSQSNQKESVYIAHVKEQTNGRYASNKYFNNEVTHASSVFDASLMSHGSRNEVKQSGQL